MLSLPAPLTTSELQLNYRTVTLEDHLKKEGSKPTPGCPESISAGNILTTSGCENQQQFHQREARLLEIQVPMQTQSLTNAPFLSSRKG